MTIHISNNWTKPNCSRTFWKSAFRICLFEKAPRKKARRQHSKRTFLVFKCMYIYKSSKLCIRIESYQPKKPIYRQTIKKTNQLVNYAWHYCLTKKKNSDVPTIIDIFNVNNEIDKNITYYNFNLKCCIERNSFKYLILINSFISLFSFLMNKITLDTSIPVSIYWIIY